MSTQPLLPHGFKKPGIILLVPTLLLSIMFLWGLHVPAGLEIQLAGNNTEDLVAILLMVALFFTGFSREKTEDEMIMQLRLNSLLKSVYINYTMLLASFLLLDTITLLNIFILSMFSILLLYIIIFNSIIYYNSKKTTYD